jgi:AcrR family transcriptional regulator
MTLYHYVATKDDLLALMDNAIMGELIVPDDELSAHWREALSQIARRSRAALERHPWAAEGLGDAYIGPNAIHHIEQSIAAVAEIEGDLVHKFEIVSMVDEYVFGYAMRRRSGGPDDPGARERWVQHVSEYIEAELGTGEYPHLEQLMPEGGLSSLWEEMAEAEAAGDRFERGLKRLLDGIELDLKRR